MKTTASHSSSKTRFSLSSVQIELGDALSCYSNWLPPTVIVSDGAYGLGLFPSDPPTSHKLPQWYEPHIAAWSQFSLPETTLWFWCNEIGWAIVHPIIEQYGWEYRALHVWDKGIGQIAGNVNSKTIRRFPVVTEVCAQYTRKVTLKTGDNQFLPIQEWLRYEWLRAGLPLSKANEACNVKNAATRKYFTKCHLWYFPPPEMMEKLSKYANNRGLPTEYPYFSLDGRTLLTGEQWKKMRSKWNHQHGITNVWSEPSIRGQERIKNNRNKFAHANQKPLRLLEQILKASSDVEDIIWEPFGGLCSTALASLSLNRRCYSAEINPDYYKLAVNRLNEEKYLTPSLF
ncbi:MAG: site-specific DNA-methyltransferase [Cyanobacteria bacterium P01_E01_bin.42]